MWPFDREKSVVVDDGIHVYANSLLEDGTFVTCRRQGVIYVSPRDYERALIDPQHLFRLRMIGRADPLPESPSQSSSSASASSSSSASSIKR